MWWILILLIVVIAAFKVPLFGKALLVCIGIVVILCAIWLLNDRHEAEVAKRRISPAEIQFDDLHLSPSYSADSFRLLGRIKNRSKRFSLQDMSIKIAMRDCIKPGECEIVGEDRVWSLCNCPPGQARDLDASVHFSNLAKPKGKYEWDYSILEIKGN